jgi:hypothetical protein
MEQQREFVMGVPDKTSTVQSVEAISEVNTYMVQYKDHEGKTQVQMVFQPKGSRSCFLLKSKISGQHVATAATEWFTKEFNGHLMGQGTVQEKGEPGEEGVAQV